MLAIYIHALCQFLLFFKIKPSPLRLYIEPFWDLTVDPYHVLYPKEITEHGDAGVGGYLN